MLYIYIYIRGMDDVWTSSVIWNINAFSKSLLLNVLHDFKGYVCLIWHLFSWDSAGSILSISKESVPG